MFMWSQMLVADELKRRKRAVGLMFFDFVEALARLADFISPPSMEKLLADNAIAAIASEMQRSGSLASDTGSYDLGSNDSHPPRNNSVSTLLPALATLVKEPSLPHQLGGGNSAYRLAKEASLHFQGGLLAKEGSSGGIQVMDRSKSRDMAEMQPPHPLVEYLQRTGRGRVRWGPSKYPCQAPSKGTHEIVLFLP